MLRLAVLLSLLAAPACSLLSSAGGTDRQAWREARATWAQAEPESYRYRVDLSCECIGVLSYAVTVTDGRAEQTALDSDGRPLAPGTRFEGETVGDGPYGPDIDGLFELLDRGLAAGNSVRAAYDAAYGFPTEAQPDVVAAAVDGSVGYRVSGFEVR